LINLYSIYYYFNHGKNNSLTRSYYACEDNFHLLATWTALHLMSDPVGLRVGTGDGCFVPHPSPA